MTALKQYARLEGTGLWRATADGQRREVAVLFGAATLVIADSAGRPLTHWSMPAMHRVNPGQVPAIFTPAASADETLELTDDEMIAAIDKVLSAVARATPRPGRLRQAGLAFVGAVVVGLGVFWLPGALLDQTLRVIPEVKRSEIGATLLGHIQRLTDSTCRDPLGTQALARLNSRLFGANGGQIVVIPDAAGAETGPVIDLPGGIIILRQGMLDATDDPAVLAGQILAATARRTGTDPLDRVLRDAGLGATLRLLTSGDIPGGILQDHAGDLVTLTLPAASPAQLLAAFAAADVPLDPWRLTLDPAGDTATGLAGAAAAGSAGAEILGDGDWISLLGICG